MRWHEPVSVFVFSTIVTTLCGSVIPDSGNNDEAENDCALDAAMSCFQPITDVQNCSNTSGTFIGLTPTCDLDISPNSLGLLCNSANETLNSCLVNLVGSSCAATNPGHAHFQAWLNPLNTLLKQLCMPESLHIISTSIDCLDESIFKCLFANTNFDLIQVLTTQIPQEICANIELRAQFCLATAPSFSIQCKPVLRLLKDLTQAFVDNTECNAQPVILVPLQESSTTASSSVDISDKTCEVNPTVLSACFEPMMTDWKCYFSGSSTCQFSLESLCKSTQEAFESCAMNLIGYGCETSKAHQREYYKWVEAIGTVQDQLCADASATSIKETQDLYFNGTVSCWTEFFSCLSSHHNQYDLLTLITDEINIEVCRKIADNIDYCLMSLGFSGHLQECDGVLDKLQVMKMAFVTSAPCDNVTVFLDESVTSNSSHQIPNLSFIIALIFIIEFYSFCNKF